jgi:hypothetical protein
MAAITPALYVAPPVAGPRRYGLFNAANILDLPTHGAAGGVEYEPETCGVTHVYTAECPITAQDPKTFDTSGPFRTEPFIVYGSIVCAPVGRPTEDQQRRATARLLAGEQSSAELALWNGAGVGARPALTLAGATPVVTALTGFGPRVAALEEAFYDAYGYQGTIHVNTRAVGAAAFAQMTVRADPAPDIPAHIVTPLGSIWSFGAGYDITGPGDVAPAAGSAWAFITPQVTVWRSDVFAPDPSQTFNRTTNQLYAIAEREYTIGYDCPTVFAIELPLEAV